MKRIIAIILSVLLYFQVYAAERTLKDSVQLEELVVTGTKFETARRIVPLSVSQISAQDIQQSGQYNVLSTLSTYVPGVFITERSILGFGVAQGGAGAINIRGIGSSPNTQVLVLIDGHPQYQGIFGHPLPDAYVASDVEKVELIRGPASVLYGSNAMAGAINIITKKQQKEGLSASLNAVYGSYNTQKYAGTVGYKKDKFNLFASLNHGRTDGIRENTDFKITNGYLKGGYDVNENWKLSADFNLAQYNANDNGPVHTPAPFNIDVLRGKTSLALENKYEKLEGALKVYHNFGDHEFSDGFISSDRNSGVMFYQTYHLFANTHITGGLDVKQYGGIANKGMAANKYKTVNEYAGYALVRQKVAGFVDLNAGLRFEHNSVFGEEWIPMVGAAVRASETTSLKTSVSKGFRSPTIMELYLYAANPTLLPESMINYEVSWLQSFFGHKLNTELTAFLSEGDNMIQVVGVPSPPKRQNIGAFSNHGIEFSAKYTLTKQLNLQANYTYLAMKKIMIGAPRHQFNINMNYQYQWFNFNLSAQHVNRLYALLVGVNPETLVRLSNFTLMNARASAKISKQLQVFVAGHNLLNQSFEINEGYPMPGINFHGGVHLNF